MTPTTPDVTLFPGREWSAALTAVVGEAPALDYGPFQGEPRSGATTPSRRLAGMPTS
jgi:hypothetical protein